MTLIMENKSNFKERKDSLMDERIRIILIILISVSIFGLLVFVFVKNYMRQKLEYFLNKKNNKKKSQ